MAISTDAVDFGAVGPAAITWACGIERRLECGDYVVAEFGAGRPMLIDLRTYPCAKPSISSLAQHCSGPF